MRYGHWRYTFFTLFLTERTLILLTNFFPICVEYDYALWMCDVRSIWRTSLYWYSTILYLELGITKSAPISSELWPEIMHTIIIAYCLLFIFGRFTTQCSLSVVGRFYCGRDNVVLDDWVLGGSNWILWVGAAGMRCLAARRRSARHEPDAGVETMSDPAVAIDLLDHGGEDGLV